MTCSTILLVSLNHFPKNSHISFFLSFYYDSLLWCLLTTIKKVGSFVVTRMVTSIMCYLFLAMNVFLQSLSNILIPRNP